MWTVKLEDNNKKGVKTLQFIASWLLKKYWLSCFRLQKTQELFWAA